MPTYTYVCEKCEHVTDSFHKLSDPRPEQVPCEQCGDPARFRISAPMVMQVALPDGTKRKGWQDLREASKLNRQRAEASDSTRKEMTQEIKKLGYKFNTEDK